jgi:hypothetical protein
LMQLLLDLRANEDWLQIQTAKLALEPGVHDVRVVSRKSGPSIVSFRIGTASDDMRTAWVAAS